MINKLIPFFKAVKSSTFNTTTVLYNNKDCDMEPIIDSQAINAFLSSEDVESQVNYLKKFLI